MHDYISTATLFQRDHEDLLREAEQQQERSRKTIDELNASVTTLTGRLREQEEALTLCKVTCQDRTQHGSTAPVYDLCNKRIILRVMAKDCTKATTEARHSTS